MRSGSSVLVAWPKSLEARPNTVKLKVASTSHKARGIALGKSVPDRFVAYYDGRRSTLARNTVDRVTLARLDPTL